MKRTVRVNAGSKADVDEEMALHIELRAKEFEDAGMSPERARAAALAAFGDQAAFAAEVHDIHDDTVRRRRWREWRTELAQDLRVGARMLRRSPGFTIVAVLTLAIGIGANTAIFSVLRSVLMRPLPYPHAEQLVQVWTDHRALGRAEPEWLTPPDYIDIRDGNHTFASMAQYQGWGPDMTERGEPESLNGLLVSGNYFSTLGVTTPAAGRLLAPSDDDAGAEPVVVLSHAFWARRFGSDRSIVGQSINLNGTPWQVVGVLPQDFRAPFPAATPDVFRAMRRPANSGCKRGCIVIRAIGRLKPGVSLAAAQTDLAVIFGRLAKEYPETNDKVGAWLIPLHEQITGNTRPALVTLAVAVGLVLLIGCVNLANLLLVRAATREREIGVRSALGAGRGRILRQLVTENALLALIGGSLGLALGVVGSRLLSPLVPETVRRVQEIRVDGGVLLFALVATLLSAALFGLLPALSAVRSGMASSARGRGEHGKRAAVTRNALVVAQLSIAVMLLVGAGLLMRSFLQLQRVDLGYRTQGVSFTNIAFPRARYADPKKTLATTYDFLSRLRANPAIRAAEITDLPVLSGGDQDIGAIPIGEPENPALPPSLWYRSITPGYLATMHMRLVAGRAFTQDDRSGGTQVGILNQEAADKYFPGKDPIGRVLAAGRDPNAPRITVVGVVASERHDGPNQPYKSEIFLPLDQFPSNGMTVVIEPAGSIALAAKAFAQALHEVDPLVPVSAFTPIDQTVGAAVALPRLYATVVGWFAGAALLLAALGVYGVMAYVVTQRKREIGVRMALGAAPRGIRGMILGQSGRLAIIRLLIGIATSLALGQLLSKLLFGVAPTDVPTLIAVSLTLALVTLVASWIPARRAMRLDPVSAIRME